MIHLKVPHEVQIVFFHWSSFSKAHLSNRDEKNLFDFNLENDFCLAFLYAKV